MKITELIAEAKAGREMWSVMNKRGQSKKFAKMDGWWEKPEAVKAWQQASTDPKEDRRLDREAATRQKGYERAERALAKKPVIDLKAVYDKAIQVIGNTFPDGDPIDTMIPWLERRGVQDYQIGETIDAAFKKHGHGAEKNGMYSYMANMWDEMSADVLQDAIQSVKAGKLPERSPFLDFNGDKITKAPNPWKSV